jgi:SAM-dependent methyltransferase
MRVSKCNLCGSRNIRKVIDLGLHPLADTFLTPEDLRDEQSFYPLQVGLCLRCGYVMSLYIVSAEKRYQAKAYSYDSSNSPISIRHFDQMATRIIQENKLSKKDLVVDIGSNVGTLLGFIKEKSSARILGVEPSQNIVMIARKNGIPTVNSFFDSHLTCGLKEKAAVILATNVFNHIENQIDFIRSVKKFLSKDGELIIEVPYLVTLLEKGAFDTIYLEHVSYFTVGAHNRFFNEHGFYIYHLERNDYMGGSIRVHVGRNKKKENSSLIKEYLTLEKEWRVRDARIYEKFSQKINTFKFDLCKKLYTVKARGGKIAGIGAATKGNTLLNFCKIDSGLVDYIAETSRLKIGKFAPGSLIPIVEEAVLKKDTALTHVVILPWNIGPFLKSKLSYLDVEFIIPQMKHARRT